MRRGLAPWALAVLSACGASGVSTPSGPGQTVDSGSPTTTGSSVVAPSTVPAATGSPTTTVPRSTAPSTRPPSTAPSNTGTVEYTVRTMGRLKGAVDVVERDRADGFVYVVSRFGTVERWRRDGTRIDRALDVTRSTTGEGERGLLGLTFRRGESGAWAAYLNMTDASGDTVIVRHDVSTDGAIAAEGTIILTIDQPYSNHNGGDLRIGPDDMLYVATGDGGSAGDPERRALDMSSLLGKILRIDPNRSGYTVPTDNPWVGTAGARPEIWSVGLRNPWRFTFADDGDLWIADVGQNEVEEVSVARATGAGPGGRGANFGWSAWEGTRRYNEDQNAPDALTPVVEYDHDGGRCSVSGAAVGTERAVPGRAGWFFYGDYCTGDLWATLAPAGRRARTEKITDDLDELTSVRTLSSGMWATTLSGEVYSITSTRG